MYTRANMYDREVLDVSIHLAAVARGAYEAEEDTDECANWLQWRVEGGWEENAKTDAFDDKVRELARIALKLWWNQ